MKNSTTFSQDVSFIFFLCATEILKMERVEFTLKSH